MLLDRSAIILAGGFSSRFGQDKGLLLLEDKPLISHILDAIYDIVDETIIVVSSEAQAENFAKVVRLNTRIIIDANEMQGPLVGALTGFEKAHGKFVLLLPCDIPLVSKDILLLLLELCVNKNAVIPRWPNGYVELLQAVYRRKPALEAARNAFREGKSDMHSIIKKLQCIRYVSTLVLQQFDPKLATFLNVNTPLDLKKAEALNKRLKKKKI